MDNISITIVYLAFKWYQIVKTYLKNTENFYHINNGLHVVSESVLPYVFNLVLGIESTGKSGVGSPLMEDIMYESFRGCIEFMVNFCGYNKTAKSSFKTFLIIQDF